MNRFTLSRDSTTRSRSPEVSSTAFSAQPPDLPPVPLMDMGFASIGPLARHRRPHHPVLVHRLAPLLHASFRPRLATTPLRFANPSPPSGWVEDFHLQAVEHARHTNKNAATSLRQFCSYFDPTRTSAHGPALLHARGSAVAPFSVCEYCAAAENQLLPSLRLALPEQAAEQCWSSNAMLYQARLECNVCQSLWIR